LRAHCNLTCDDRVDTENVIGEEIPWELIMFVRPLTTTDEGSDDAWTEIPLDDVGACLGALAVTQSIKFEGRFSSATSLKKLRGFSSLISLQKIEIPASVNMIASGAFMYCSSLREVTFAANGCLRELDGFSQCRSLLKIKIPSTVETIGSDAFRNCHALLEVTFAPGSRLKVCSGFAECDSLPRIVIPIEDGTYLYVVRNCFPDLNEFRFSLPKYLNPKSPFLKHFGGLALLRGSTREWSFFRHSSEKCYLLDEPISEFVSLPEFFSMDDGGRFPISRISDRLFCLCALRSIPIPPFIREIESSFSAIDACVETFEISPSIERIDGFLRVQTLAFLTFCPGSQLREIRGFSLCSSLRRIAIPISVESIHAFNQCRLLTDVVFEPETRVRELRGFYHCSSLVEIHIPRSVEIVSGLRKCKRLARIVFDPKSLVRNIYGFDDCKFLCELEIPASCESIVGFDRCWGLKTVVFASPSHTGRFQGFTHCPYLSRIEIPASVELIFGFEYSGLWQFTLERGTRIISIPNRIFVDYDLSDLKTRRRLASAAVSPQRRWRKGKLKRTIDDFIAANWDSLSQPKFEVDVDSSGRFRYVATYR
jgi:hypothetical protein